ncbi:hypothetical protein F2Q68_00033367 [Brassica cretica]|uniref:Uncharacterized protein n=1 Tax=Brassica cretica TaxID=69181 RepID=A0A8S9GWQ8_BRACR|nr:hypothetical protein F2Q68_00033367 [Brassica cretica]
MGVLQSKEVTRLEMEDAGNTRLDKDKIQLQATKILLQRQVYVDHAAVSTRNSRPFSVWHRWRSKDCIHGGSETVDLQYHFHVEYCRECRRHESPFVTIAMRSKIESFFTYSRLIVLIREFRVTNLSDNSKVRDVAGKHI